jgi:hypothetical protein
MSDSVDNDLDLDLHFLPSWAKEPSNRNLYADFEGERGGRPGRDRGDRPFRHREGPPMPGRQGPRPPGDRRRPEGGRPRPEFRRGPQDRGRGGPGRPERGPREERPVRLEPLPEIRVDFRPDDNGVDSLARQIKMTGRAYPLFGVAQMILAKPERHWVTFSVKKTPDGQVVQPLFVCALDETLWLAEEEAVDYVLDRHFNTFYQAERTAIEPPKGTYTFVAQCGMSGTILGPPNHHDYQNQLRRLHGERFSRMPFEVFKSRVRIVRDEAIVKKWLDSQSWRTEYVCLNLTEPLRLGSLEEVRQHFRETHLPNIVQPVESHTMAGTASRGIRNGPLMRLVRTAWEDQKRFPLQISTVLSQQFAARGLQFFKVNKNVTHVAVARPHFLDLELEPVSEGVRRVVVFINEHPRCTRRQVMEALAPAPPAPPVEPAPAATAPVPTAGEVAPTEPGPTAAPDAGASAQAAPAPAVPEPSPEATAVISDLHWLIHQGHVIEFADGLLETAKKPIPRPPKPPRKAMAEPIPGAPPSDAELAAEVVPPPPGEADETAGAESVSGAEEAPPADADAIPAEDLPTEEAVPAEAPEVAAEMEPAPPEPTGEDVPADQPTPPA